MSRSNNLVLFDDDCGLCSHCVQFVKTRDLQSLFLFIPQQSEKGRVLCHQHGLNLIDLDTLILFRNNKALLKSDAVLEIARQLGGLWKLSLLFYLIPHSLRDGLYDFIARNRYRWFGKYPSCKNPQGD